MKLLLCLIIIPVVSFSQDTMHFVFPLQDNKVHFERIITNEKLNAEKLYTIIKAWGVNSFVSQKAALQADDKEAGLLAYKFRFNNNVQLPLSQEPKSLSSDFWAVMKIFIKDKRVKVVVENINVSIDQTDFNVETYQTDMQKVGDALIEETKKVMRVTDKMKKQMEQSQKNHYLLAQKSFVTANTQITELINNLEKEIIKDKPDTEF